MQEGKLFKKEVLFLCIGVCILIVAVSCFSYAYFMSIDRGQSNIISVGDLNISFCVDETCKKDYANFGQVIGTKNVDGKSVIDNIYPYENEMDALKQQPYIFNIKNTGSLKTYVTIRLKEDKDYVLSDNYSNFTNLSELYSNHIKVAINDCSQSINRENAYIQSYGSLNDNIILNNEKFESGYDKTYCLWTYLDDSTPNEVQNTYFVANLDFKAEYKPN